MILQHFFGPRVTARLPGDGGGMPNVASGGIATWHATAPARA